MEFVSGCCRFRDFWTSILAIFVKTCINWYYKPSENNNLGTKKFEFESPMLHDEESLCEIKVFLVCSSLNTCILLLAPVVASVAIL